MYESIKSIYNLYKGSNWLEREIWDMFGVFFFKHKISEFKQIMTKGVIFRSYQIPHKALLSSSKVHH